MSDSFAPGMKLSARALQVQQQRMSQQQIMSLKLLAMGSLDLRDEVYKKAAENPALEITGDSLEQGAKNVRENPSRFSDNTRYGSATAAGQLASDNFQAALESHVDDRETLQEHLESQFNSMRHTPEEEALGLRLIHNLDASGFHLLAPVSLLDKNNPVHTPAFLQKCMEKIQALDPAGTCCSGTEESLLVQAKLRGDAPDAVLFILDGHLDFLNPPQSAKVLKKIEAFIKDRASLAFTDERETALLSRAEKEPFTEADIDEAISYIRTLDPYPARNFSAEQAHYISPDVYVERIPETEEDEKNGVVESGGYSFKLTLARESLPKVGISKNYAAQQKMRKNLLMKGRRQKKNLHRMPSGMQKCLLKVFIFGKRPLQKPVQKLYAVRHDFLRKVPGILSPCGRKILQRRWAYMRQQFPVWQAESICSVIRACLKSAISLPMQLAAKRILLTVE